MGPPEGKGTLRPPLLASEQQQMTRNEHRANTYPASEDWPVTPLL